MATNSQLSLSERIEGVGSVAKKWDSDKYFNPSQSALPGVAFPALWVLAFPDLH